MLDRIFNSGYNQLLIKAMDAASLRNEVIANNIANVETPGFKKSEVIFSEKIKKVLQNTNNHGKLVITNPRHISINTGTISEVNPEICTITNTSYRNDGNNVDIDVEMAESAKNKIYYDALSQSISNEIRLLRLAITEGE